MDLFVTIICFSPKLQIIKFSSFGKYEQPSLGFKFLGKPNEHVISQNVKIKCASYTESISLKYLFSQFFSRQASSFLEDSRFFKLNLLDSLSDNPSAFMIEFSMFEKNWNSLPTLG